MDSSEELCKIGIIAKKIVNHYLEQKIPGHEFMNFPAGCCGLFTNVFQKYLLNKGYKKIIRVRGIDSDEKSHAWLEFENKIIDLTINQFGYNYQSFIFDIDEPFYKKYKIIERNCMPASKREDDFVLLDIIQLLGE